MKRAVCVVAALFSLAAAVFAQDSKKVLETFRRNFDIASLDVKIQILQDAAAGSTAADMGPLFQQALDFVVDNATLIPSDPRYRQLTASATGYLAKFPYPLARGSLWKMYVIDSDTTTLVNSAAALGLAAAGDAEIVGSLNRWLEAQNTLFASGKPIVSLQVIAATLRAVGKLGDASSFAPVFSAMSLGYSDEMVAISREALFSLRADLKDSLLAVVRTRPYAEKKAALQMALESDRLSEEQKGQVAELALDIGVRTVAADVPGRTALRELRFAAARALGDRKWSRATSLLVEHLDATIGEYDKGLADRRYLIEAAAALGAAGTHEAAVRLTQYLLLVNSYTEKLKGYDEQVVMAIIAALGRLGDRVAFDDLMYTQYLGYSAPVKKAAREALEKLKW